MERTSGVEPELSRYEGEGLPLTYERILRSALWIC